MNNILRIIIFSFFTIILSCSSSFDKSILEELTQEEVDELADRYQDFEFDYKGIQYIKSKQLHNLSDSIYFGNITYRQYYDFGLLAYDSTFYKPLIRKFHNEWESRYGYVNRQIDSIRTSWIKKKNNFILDNIITINVLDTDLDSEDDYAKVILEFTIIPHQDDIQTVSFNVILSPIESGLEWINNSDCSLYLNIDSIPVTDHTYLHEFSIDSTIPWLSKNGKYSYEFQLLKINNTLLEKYRISDSYFEIPIFITNLLIHPDDDVAKSILLDSFISKDIPWKTQYVFGELNIAYRNYDSVCYDFLDYYIDYEALVFDSSKIDTTIKRYDAVLETADDE